MGAPQTVAGTSCATLRVRGRDRQLPRPRTSRRTTSTTSPASARSACAANTPTAATCRGCSIRSVEFEGPLLRIVAAAVAPEHLHRTTAGADDQPTPAGDPRLRHARLPAARSPPRKRQSLSGRVSRSRTRAGRSFQDSVKDALQVVLTSPQFLFLIETSATPAARAAGRLRTGLQAVVLPVERPAGRRDAAAGRERHAARSSSTPRSTG